MNPGVIWLKLRKLHSTPKVVAPAHAGTQSVLRKPGFRPAPE